MMVEQWTFKMPIIKNFAVNKSTFEKKKIKNGKYLYFFYNTHYTPSGFSYGKFIKLTKECRLYLIEPYDGKYACYSYYPIRGIVYNTECNRLLSSPRGHYFVIENIPKACFVADAEPNSFIRSVPY